MKDKHAFLRSVLAQGPTMVSCNMVRPLLEAYDKLALAREMGGEDDDDAYTFVGRLGTALGLECDPYEIPGKERREAIVAAVYEQVLGVGELRAELEALRERLK